MKKSKVLCVCAQGINRSRYLAGYLQSKGYKTRFGGIEKKFFGLKPSIPVKQEDVDWADVVVIVRKRLVPLFKKEFKFSNKRLIVLDVTDSQRLLPKKFEYLRKVSYEEFAKKYRDTMLRRGINKYLPL